MFLLSLNTHYLRLLDFEAIVSLKPFLLTINTCRSPDRRFIAVKVFASDTNPKEIELDRLLPSPGCAHPGTRHLELTLDSFFIEGSHGRHFCRVVEPLGRNLGQVMQDAENQRSALNHEHQLVVNFNPMRVLEGDPWTISFAKRACHQILLGLDALHSHRIAHRDLHPANVCMAFTYDLSSMCENRIQRDIWADYPQAKEEVEAPEDADKAVDQGPSIGAEERDAEDESDADSDSSSDSEGSVEREERLQREREIEEEKMDIEQQWHEFELDPGNHKVEPHSLDWNKANFLKSRAEVILRPRTEQASEPRYFVAARPLEDTSDPFSPNSSSRFILTDFGCACTFNQCETHPRAGRGLIDFMPPEWLLGLPTGPQGDIFSLGLLFFEIVMLRRLVTTAYKRDDPLPERPYARSRLIHSLASRLGPLPSKLRACLKDADKLFGADGKALEFVELEGNENYYDPGVWGPECYEWGDVGHQAKFRKPLDMSDGDLEVFVELLRSMMQWDPERRPSTSDLLTHEWFRDLGLKDQAGL